MYKKHQGGVKYSPLVLDCVPLCYSEASDSSSIRTSSTNSSKRTEEPSCSTPIGIGAVFAKCSMIVRSFSSCLSGLTCECAHFTTSDGDSSQRGQKHGRRVMEHIHEGILYQDQHKHSCLYEPGMSPHQRLTCPSGPTRSLAQSSRDCRTRRRRWRRLLALHRWQREIPLS